NAAVQADWYITKKKSDCSKVIVPWPSRHSADMSEH
ncbi:unnamed protein product, partial [marine sediment metagenome]